MTTVPVFFDCVTHNHKLNILKHFLLHSLFGSRVWASLSWVLHSGSHKIIESSRQAVVVVVVG